MPHRPGWTRGKIRGEARRARATPEGSNYSVGGLAFGPGVTGAERNLFSTIENYWRFVNGSAK